MTNLNGRTQTMTRIATLVALLLASVTLSGCEAIATIFEAGIWVGVILVLIVVGIIFFIARALGGRR
jgi:hypothetical protein